MKNICVTCPSNLHWTEEILSGICDFCWLDSANAKMSPDNPLAELIIGRIERRNTDIGRARSSGHPHPAELY
jgi:hypothetical protein